VEPGQSPEGQGEREMRHERVVLSLSLLA
jgi:hypothetical protein